MLFDAVSANKDIERALRSKTAQTIFKVILTKFGLSVTEIVERTGLLQPAVSRTLTQLKKARLIKFELKISDKERAVQKLVYPSMKWGIEDTLRAGNIEITKDVDKQLDTFEDFFFKNEKMKKYLEGKFTFLEKKDISLPSLMGLWLPFVFEFLEKIRESERKEDKELYAEFLRVNNPVNDLLKKAIMNVWGPATSQ